MNCEGQGVSRSGRRSGGAAAGDAGTATGVDASMMNVWGDFMSEEMSSAPAGSAPVAAASAAAPAAAASSAKKAESPSAESPSDKPAAAKSSSEEGPRSYVFPIQPRMRLSGGGKKSSNDNDDDVPTPGLLAQTGTLDASV